MDTWRDVLLEWVSLDSFSYWFHTFTHPSHVHPQGKLHRTAASQLPKAEQNRHQCVLQGIPTPHRHARQRRAVHSTSILPHLLPRIPSRPAARADPSLVAVAALLVRPIAHGRHPAQMQRPAAGHPAPIGRILHRHAPPFEAHQLRAPQRRHRRIGGQRSGISGWCQQCHPQQ